MNNDINILDSSVYNLIAAGEVVERPRSVVKELAENSIDALAKRIKIEIEGGGIRKIRVTDDGTGISAENIRKAFLPHATSKIARKDDLECITTLGFRGEALASIASVSHVDAKSVTAEDDAANGIILSAGKITEEYACALNSGTVITVSDLFFNTPARIKFLKKPKTEEGYVTELVEQLILSNPYVAFEYYADGKKILESNGKGLKDAVFSIYPREIAMNFMPIENTRDNFAITGFISVPTYTRPNRNYQTVIVNGRVISNKTVSTAIEKAYEGYTVKRTYPMCVINLTVPYDFVDVNVHPGKADVRFQDNNRIFGFVFKSILDAVSSYNAFGTEEIFRKDEILSNREKAEEKDKESLKPLSESPAAEKYDVYTPVYKDNIYNEVSEHGEYCASDEDFKQKLKNLSAGRDSFKPSVSALKDDICRYAPNKSAAAEDSRAATGDKVLFKRQSEEIFGLSYKLLGQLFSAYILVEKDDALFIIDQHAVHERMIYDSLSEPDKNVQQPLLVPFSFDVSQYEYPLVEELLPHLNSIGIEIEPFGRLSFKISALPLALTDMKLGDFFNSLLKDISSSFLKISTREVITDRLKQTACKAAIKAGNALSEEQIKALLKSVDTAAKIPLQCPHGRPAIIRLSKAEVEKMFKRIV